MQWRQNLSKTDSVIAPSLNERLAICYLAFKLPPEALADIKEEMLDKIQWYKELAEYDDNSHPVAELPAVNVVLEKAITRPPFYVPFDED